jgi:hypothetical protein
MVSEAAGTVAAIERRRGSMDFATLERRMAADGWTWDGEGPEDLEGRFVKSAHVSLTIAGAEEYLWGREDPGDELGG